MDLFIFEAKFKNTELEREFIRHIVVSVDRDHQDFWETALKEAIEYENKDDACLLVGLTSLGIGIDAKR